VPGWPGSSVGQTYNPALKSPIRENNRRKSFPFRSLLSEFSYYSRSFGQDLVKIFGLAFMFIFLFAGPLFCLTDDNFVDVINILRKEFSERIGDNTEKLVFICGDRQVVSFTGHQYNFAVKLTDIIKALARTGNNLTTVVAVAHNHRRNDDFSSSDIEILQSLRKLGFHGDFLIYYPAQNRIKKYKPEK
jgi:hypothetical protein